MGASGGGLDFLTFAFGGVKSGSSAIIVLNILYASLIPPRTPFGNNGGFTISTASATGSSFTGGGVVAVNNSTLKGVAIGTVPTDFILVAVMGEGGGGGVGNPF